MPRRTAPPLSVVASLLIAAACGGGAGRPSPDEEALYQKAYEAAIWATPILHAAQRRAELRRHGAKDGDLAYLGSRPNGRVELPMLETTAPYVFGGGSLKAGPIVIEVPPASPRARFAGSVMTVWGLAIEDFGPAGVDAGKGGRFLLLPPGSSERAPAGYTPLQSSTFEFQLWLRSVPARSGDDGWRNAVEYAKTLKVYPLASAGSPAPAGWFDISRVKGYFHGNASFAQGSFKLIDEYVQNEPVQEGDQAMHATLAEIGIVRGQPFAPDEATSTVLDRAARDVEAFLRGELEHGRAFDPYWPTRAWGGARTLDGTSDARARAVQAFFFRAASHASGSGGVGVEPLTLLSAVDAQGRPLDGGKAYRLRLPLKGLARDYWSVTLYSTRTRAVMDTEKFSLSSRDKLQINRDGSVDLEFAPLPPAGRDANWLAIRPGEHFVACLRFHGPAPALTKRTWTPADVEALTR
jgi:hypothetical protein